MRPGPERLLAKLRESGETSPAKVVELLELTDVQRDAMDTAFVLQRANGSIDARGRERQTFKMNLRRLARMELVHERFTGVFDLTPMGFLVGQLLNGRRHAAKPRNQ